MVETQTFGMFYFWQKRYIWLVQSSKKHSANTVDFHYVFLWVKWFSYKITHSPGQKKEICNKWFWNDLRIQWSIFYPSHSAHMCATCSTSSHAGKMFAYFVSVRWSTCRKELAANRTSWVFFPFTNSTVHSSSAWLYRGHPRYLSNLING